MYDKSKIICTFSPSNAKVITEKLSNAFIPQRDNAAYLELSRGPWITVKNSSIFMNVSNPTTVWVTAQKTKGSCLPTCY